jgi:acetyl esterase/lipase
MKFILCCLLLNICSSATAHSSVEPRPPKQTFVYKRVDNIAIKADVYRLAGDDRRPVIVWIHPGGLIMGSREMLPADERERFRDTGFVVAAIDYRLARRQNFLKFSKTLKMRIGGSERKAQDCFK